MGEGEAKVAAIFAQPAPTEAEKKENGDKPEAPEEKEVEKKSLFGDFKPAAGGLFGSSSALLNNQTKTGGLFGNNSGSSIFGNGASIFDNKDKEKPAGLFGSTEATKPSSLFGNTPSGSLFANTSSSLFGGQTNLFQ